MKRISLVEKTAATKIFAYTAISGHLFITMASIHPHGEDFFVAISAKQTANGVHMAPEDSNESHLCARYIRERHQISKFIERHIPLEAEDEEFDDIEDSSGDDCIEDSEDEDHSDNCIEEEEETAQQYLTPCKLTNKAHLTAA